MRWFLDVAVYSVFGRGRKFGCSCGADSRICKPSRRDCGGRTRLRLRKGASAQAPGSECAGRGKRRVTDANQAERRIRGNRWPRSPCSIDRYWGFEFDDDLATLSLLRARVDGPAINPDLEESHDTRAVSRICKRRWNVCGQSRSSGALHPHHGCVGLYGWSAHRSIKRGSSAVP